VAALATEGKKGVPLLFTGTPVVAGARNQPITPTARFEIPLVAEAA
jgi:hypothetical protein